MDREKELLELAEMYYRMEKGMARYYRLCVEIMPEHVTNWALLRKQEEEHAAVFKSIIESIKENPLRWECGRFAASIIKTMVDGLNTKITEIENGNVNPNYVLTYIADFERSLVEGDVGQSFKTDDRELEVALKRIQEETTNHRRILLEITGNK